MINKKIIVASRNSTLAKTQTELVVSQLKYAGYKNIEKVFLKSKGDQISKTEFKKFQRRLANASTMEELLEIKKNLGSGFEINNDLNEISYKYNREAFKPDEAAEDKAIHDLITQLQEKIKAKDTKHYFKEISAPLESAMDNYKKEKPAGNTK